MKKVIGIMMSVILIYSMIFYAAGTNEWVNKAVCIFALISMCCLLFSKEFKDKLPKIIKEPIVIGAYSYFAIYIISTLYAKVGKIAFDEMTKFIIAISIFTITLIVVNRDNMRFALKFLSGMIGVLGLLNIDLAGAKILSYPFIFIVNKIVPNIQAYGNFLSPRIWTAFGNPNVFAPIMAVGILISAYLYMTALNKKEKIFSAIMLAFSWIAFILCVSLGAIFIFGLSVIIFIVFMEKENRINTFLTMLISAIVAVLFAIVIFMILKANKNLYLTDLVMVMAGIVNWVLLTVLDRFVVKISDKIIKITGISVLALVLLYIVLAINLTAPYLQESFNIRRAFYPKAGEYTIKVDSDKAIYVTLYSQNIEQAQNYATTTVINKKLDKSNREIFTVNEDVKVMYVRLSGDNATLNKVEIIDSNGKARGIDLKYILLPEFITDRFIGLRANQSMLQRFVFCGDGLKLFVKSPLFGNGVGAFETEINSIRNVNYETRYTHNVGVTVLLEQGAIGILIFGGVIFAVFYTLMRRKSEYGQLKATLLATFTMILGHSFIEVDINYTVALSLLFIIIAITQVAFCRDRENYKPIKSLWVSTPIILISVIFIVLLVSNLYGQKYLRKEEKGQEVFSILKRYMTFDPYNRADYILSYMSHAEANGNKEEAKIYLDKLKNSYAYASCEYIERYYIEEFDLDTVFQLSKLTLQKNRSEQDVWRAEFQYYETLVNKKYLNMGKFEDRYEEILDMVLSSYTDLKEINKELFKKINLHERNLNLVARVLKAKEILPDYGEEDTIDKMEEFVYDSDIMVDVNNDGNNDNYKISKDNKSMSFTIFIKASTLSKFKGEIEADNPSDIKGVSIGGKPKEFIIEGNKVIFDIFTQGNGNTEIKINSNNASSINRVRINKVEL